MRDKLPLWLTDWLIANLAISLLLILLLLWLFNKSAEECNAPYMGSEFYFCQSELPEVPLLLLLYRLPLMFLGTNKNNCCNNNIQYSIPTKYSGECACSCKFPIIDNEEHFVFCSVLFWLFLCLSLQCGRIIESWPPTTSMCNNCSFKSLNASLQIPLLSLSFHKNTTFLSKGAHLQKIIWFHFQLVRSSLL